PDRDPDEEIPVHGPTGTDTGRGGPAHHYPDLPPRRHGPHPELAVPGAVRRGYRRGVPGHSQREGGSAAGPDGLVVASAHLAGRIRPGFPVSLPSRGRHSSLSVRSVRGIVVTSTSCGLPMF